MDKKKDGEREKAGQGSNPNLKRFTEQEVRELISEERWEELAKAAESLPEEDKKRITDILNKEIAKPEFEEKLLLLILSIFSKEVGVKDGKIVIPISPSTNPDGMSKMISPGISISIPSAKENDEENPTELVIDVDKEKLEKLSEIQDPYKELRDLIIDMFQKNLLSPLINDIKKLPKVKEEPKLPVNNLFIAMQRVGEKEVKIGKGKKRTVVGFGEFLPKNAFEQALYLSVEYSLVYYATKNIKEIKLTDLMENIGYPKREGHGYLESQKKEVLDMVMNVAKNEIRAEYQGEELPFYIKELFPNVVKGDYFTMEAFTIKTLKHYGKDKKLKDAMISFTPNFNPEKVKFDRDSDVLSLPLSDPEFKNLAIFITYGKRLKGEKTVITVKELLNVIKIQVDREHPQRTYEKLRRVLKEARREELISKVNLQEIGGQGETWLDRWLDSEVTLEF